MVRGYWVVLRGTGGELNREFCRREEQITATILGMVRETGMFGAGDSISVEEGESEIDD